MEKFKGSRFVAPRATSFFDGGDAETARMVLAGEVKRLAKIVDLLTEEPSPVKKPETARRD